MPTARKGYLYRHIRLDKNEPFYIGIGFSLNQYAAKGFYRAKSKKGRNKIWKDIVNKSEYEVEILFEDMEIDDLFKKEIEFIKLYGRIDKKTGTLANLTDGGEGALGSRHNLGKRHSKETKLKISKNRKGSRLGTYNHKHLFVSVNQYDLNMNLIKTYSHIKETKLYGFDHTSVGKCCKGIQYRKTHAGFIWKYADKNINK